jgi:hypothetical protein
MTHAAGQGRPRDMTFARALSLAATVLLAACSSHASSSGNSTGPTMSGAGMVSTVPPGSPADGACQGLDEKACDAAPDCRSTFEVGVTAWDAKSKGTEVRPRYAGCRLGSRVSCTKPSMNCDEPDPACEAAGLRIHWSGGCHQGCVRSANCEP